LPNDLGLVFVFGAFQIAIGLALGHGLRSLIVGHDLEGLGTGLWSLAAGTILSIVSVSLALSAGQPLLAAGSVALFLASALLSWSVLPRLLGAIGGGPIAGAGFGLIFMLLGLTTAVNGVHVRDLGGLAAGGLFFLVGALIAWSAVGPMLKGEPPGRF
jgi:hypothetical protein